MIIMTGMDHTNASLDRRSCFAMTKESMRRFIPFLKKELNAEGVVLLSTCSRFEVWVSGDHIHPETVIEKVCNYPDQSGAFTSEDFMIRKEERAVRHLFNVACGLESAIFAEDQILTQVNDALAFSRAVYCSGHTLEVLFRSAVTSAKKIKTSIRFTRLNENAIDSAVRKLKENGLICRGSKCMVIGNGSMGKASALRLKQECDDVKVTIRQYHSGEVQIPPGCSRIDYGKRLEYLPFCDIVVSATSSPHFTLKAEDFTNLNVSRRIIFIDLAVPRDIDPELSRLLPGSVFYNIDDFRTGRDESDMVYETQADFIIRENMKVFYDWLGGREWIPRIQDLQRETAEELVWRARKALKTLDVEEDKKTEFNNQLKKTSEKVMGKVLFSLRNNLEDEEFQKCISVLEKEFLNVQDRYQQ